MIKRLVFDELFLCLYNYTIIWPGSCYNADMKKKIFALCCFLLIVSLPLIQSCSDDIGPTQQCNDCTSDFPWSTDGSDTCYETKDRCESAEGVECFVCL